MGNGDQILLWWDHRIDNTRLVDLLDLELSSIDNPQLRVSNFITRNRCWDEPAIRLLIHQDDIIEKILGIPLPQFPTEDSFCWGFTGTGQFSMKTATWATHDSFQVEVPKWPFAWIWNLNILPRIKIFLS